MIEKTVIQYLTNALEVGVYMESPESYPNPTETPKEFVRVEKTGSSLENKIYTATLAIQSYANNILLAAELNEKVKEAMLQITTLDEVTSVDLISDYNFTDTSKKQPRYQAVFELVHY